MAQPYDKTEITVQREHARPHDAVSIASVEKKAAERDIVQLKSEHDTLGIWKTVWRFRKVSHTVD